MAVIVFAMLNIVVSPIAGLIFGWKFVAAYDLAILITALVFIVYWALLTVYRYGDQGASYSRNTVSNNAAVSIPMSIITEEPQSYSAPVKSSVPCWPAEEPMASSKILWPCAVRQRANYSTWMSSTERKTSSP